MGHCNRYIPGRWNNSFSGLLSTGIGLAIIFDSVWWKIYTPKYNGNLVRGLPSKRYNKTARRFDGVFKK